MRIGELLQRGVDLGIITGSQQTSLLALDSEGGTDREATRGVNAITIAYGVGALVVLFAFAWLFIERWKTLGDAGLLGVSLVYATLFLLAARVLAREGFPAAHGLAVLFAVAMAPLAMRSFGRLAGIWPADALASCGGVYVPFFPCEAEFVAMELAAAAAALVALRRVAFAPLVIPVAVAGLVIPLHLVRAWTDSGWGNGVSAWAWLLSGSLMLAAAYTVDRRRKMVDHALWLHVAAAVAGLVAFAGLFDTYRELRHFSGPVALLAFAGAVYLRRIVYLIVGAIVAFAYLAWLAAEVFRVTLAFPLVLAVTGLGIIVAAVWLQRRFPALVARARGPVPGPPHFPGGVAALLAPALLAILMLPEGSARDREIRLSQAARLRVVRGSMRHAPTRRTAPTDERRARNKP